MESHDEYVGASSVVVTFEQFIEVTAKDSPHQRSTSRSSSWLSRALKEENDTISPRHNLLIVGWGKYSVFTLF